MQPSTARECNVNEDLNEDFSRVISITTFQQSSKSLQLAGFLVKLLIQILANNKLEPMSLFARISGKGDVSFIHVIPSKRMMIIPRWIIEKNHRFPFFDEISWIIFTSPLPEILVMWHISSSMLLSLTNYFKNFIRMKYSKIKPSQIRDKFIMDKALFLFW